MPKPIFVPPALGPLGTRLVAEGFTSFMLVLTIAQVSVSLGVFHLAPIAIGGCVVVCVAVSGFLGSGLFNPAVALGVYLSGNLGSFSDLLAFWGAEIIGGLCGAFLGAYTCGDIHAFPSPQPKSDKASDVFRAFIVELVYTCFLVFTVLQTVASRQKNNNHFFPISIGLSIMVGIYSSSEASGGSINPMVTTGLQLAKCAIDKCDSLKYWILYIVAELLGAVLAYVIFGVCDSWHQDQHESFWKQSNNDNGNDNDNSNTNSNDNEKQPLINSDNVNQKYSEVR